MKKILLWGVITLTASGCASIMEGKNQPVSVQTHEKGMQVAGASCTLTNDKGTWFVTTPGSVVVQKSYGDLLATCNKDGHQPGSAAFSSSANGGAWGNILAGGGIGYIIDRSNGAGFNYPSMLSVELGVENTKPIPPNKDEQTSSTNTSGKPEDSPTHTVDSEKATTAATAIQ
jgi:uncharacterized protein YceK